MYESGRLLLWFFLVPDHMLHAICSSYIIYIYYSCNNIYKKRGVAMPNRTDGISWVVLLMLFKYVQEHHRLECVHVVSELEYHLGVAGTLVCKPMHLQSRVQSGRSI